LAYYSIKNSMGIWTGYLLVKNDEFYCIGTTLHNGDNKLYTFVIQSKTDLNKSMQINFFGYESQDEVVEVLSSLKIKWNFGVTGIKLVTPFFLNNWI
jgi:hypothetical protein